MININIQMDIDRALSKLARVPAEVESKALVRALNKTADQAKVQASREIRAAGYNVKAAAIKKSISIRRASSGQLFSSLRASGTPIPLAAYGAKQVKNGVTVSVKNGRKLIRGAFIATMPNGHTGVFERVGKAHKKIARGGVTVWSGLPIQELYGPSIPSAFMNASVQEALITAVRDRFPRLFENEVKFLQLNA